MVSAMVGDDSAGQELTKKHQPPGSTTLPEDAPVVLDAEELHCPGYTDPFSLRLRAGEVVGLAGHAGSGSRRIALSLAGHHQDWTGRVQLQDRQIQAGRWDPHTAVRTGVTLVPEDRIKTGLVGGMSIEDNITFTTLRA